MEKVLKFSKRLLSCVLCFLFFAQAFMHQATATDHISIEAIETGDLVWAENPETGEKALKTVVRTFVNESDELIHLSVAGEEIITTPEHPFYVPQKGWTAAIQLRAGDLLVMQNGEYVVLEKIQHEILESPVKVYNFEVADFHTYFVSDVAVLVHNMCSASSTALPKNGQTVDVSTALDMADDYLGRGYSEVSTGRFVSADGLRQVRMTNADLSAVNNHAGAPHINFDSLSPKYKSVHVYLLDN